jgi:hypothetical protein
VSVLSLAVRALTPYAGGAGFAAPGGVAVTCDLEGDIGVEVHRTAFRVWVWDCACVCVCERERERGSAREGASESNSARDARRLPLRHAASLRLLSRASSADAQRSGAARSDQIGHADEVDHGCTSFAARNCRSLSR